MKLKTNMRLLRAADDPDATEQEKFAKWLLKVGEGHVPTVDKLDDNIIQLPNDIVLPSQNINDLIHFVYPDLFTNSNPQYLVERAILAPKNDHISTINAIIMDQFPKEAIEYLSADKIEEQSESENQYLIEFLNSLTIGNLPSHKLILKLGSPIILLRNIHPPDGLCNGTRLVCHSFQNHVIEVEIITEKHAGIRAFIPHITLSSSNTTL